MSAKAAAKSHYNHENFEVSTASTRLKVVRQDRKLVEHLNVTLEVGSKKFKVMNLSTYGLAVLDEQNLLGQTELNEGALIFEQYEIGMHKLKFIRFNEETRVAALEVVGEPIFTGRIDGVEAAITLLKASSAELARHKDIPDLFARKVLEIKDWLNEIKRQLNLLPTNQYQSDSQMQREYEDVIIQVVGSYLNQILPTKNAELMSFTNGLSEDSLKACFDFFRSKLYDLIYESPFAHRTFHKPLGYAGDYEMMNIIYQGDRLGQTLFAKTLNYFWVSQPAAVAVKNRANYLTTKLRTLFAEKAKSGKKLRILSVACGPAMEWQKFIESCGEFSNVQAEIDLLDQDENALKHAQLRMKTLSQKHPNKFTFNFINKAIKNIITKGLDFKEYDLIYTAGLFDYFSDPVAQLAGQRLAEALATDGNLIIGNFNINNPNQIMMTIALDWNLIYRSEEDLHRLFGHLGSISIEKEDLEINLFCKISKK